MKGTFSWKWAVLALSVAALVAAGCAKKQTVKSEGAQGAPGEVSAPAPAPISEAPAKEAPPAPMAVTPAMPPAAAPGVAVTEEKISRFDDVRFDFDKSVVKEDGRKTCQIVADYLKAHPNAQMLIEGHCDERGTAEYNMALGERRATAVMTYLVSLGVPKGTLSTVSFGKERPLDPGHNEEAWAKNRRAHFVLK